MSDEKPWGTGWICGNNYRERGVIIDSLGKADGEPWYETKDGVRWSSYDVRFKPDTPAEATRPDPQCMAGSFEQPGCAAGRLQGALNDATIQIERLTKAAEVYAAERNHARAMFESACSHLSHIHMLIQPEGVMVDGRKLVFVPPEPLNRQMWEALSKAIRDVPAAIEAAKEAKPIDKWGRT